jgi:hypothetical protein
MRQVPPEKLTVSALVKKLPALYDMIYLLTAIGLSPGGSRHLHTNNTQNNTNNNRTTQIQANAKQCGPCPVFARFTLTFALKLRKKHGKPSVRVHYRVHSSPPRDCVLNQMIKVTPSRLLFETTFNIIIPPPSRSSKWCLSCRLQHLNLYIFSFAPYIIHTRYYYNHPVCV